MVVVTMVEMKTALLSKLCCVVQGRVMVVVTMVEM